MRSPGTLYGIGLGPGDPELITLKAQRLLARLPVVFVPVQLGSDTSFAATIAAPHLDPARQEIVRLPFAMGRDRATMAARWRENADRIAARLAEGDDAAFLTEGDPLLYSTFVHVYRELAQRHRHLSVRIVPGVTSATAAAAAARRPLVDEAECLAILPAPYVLDTLADTLRRFDTVVLLKVHRVFDRVLALLEEMDLVEGAVAITRCGRPEERIEHDLRALRGQPLDYFTLLILRGRSDA